jgi:hypothetical protein
VAPKVVLNRVMVGDLLAHYQSTGEGAQGRVIKKLFKVKQLMYASISTNALKNYIHDTCVYMTTTTCEYHVR